MDTLCSNTTKKYFNTTLPYDEIVRAYKENDFPDSYCLVCEEHDMHHDKFTESDLFDNMNS